MTDAERFEVVLGELRRLTIALGDLAEHLVLVGGQVIAVEAKKGGGTGVIAIRSPTGTMVERGFSFEPDLLFDVDAAARLGEILPAVLRQCGFERGRANSWVRQAGEVTVKLDLFVPPDADESAVPTPMTRMPGGDVVIARAVPLSFRIAGGEITLAIPDPVGFITAKIEARKIRPEETKDSFDLYAYVARRGASSISTALSSAPEGRRLRDQLRSLFGDVSAPGVLDVLSYAPTLEENDRALLARAVVDLFSQL